MWQEVACLWSSILEVCWDRLCCCCSYHEDFFCLSQKFAPSESLSSICCSFNWSSPSVGRSSSLLLSSGSDHVSGSHGALSEPWKPGPCSPSSSYLSSFSSRSLSFSTPSPPLAPLFQGQRCNRSSCGLIKGDTLSLRTKSDQICEAVLNIWWGWAQCLVAVYLQTLSWFALGELMCEGYESSVSVVSKMFFTNKDTVIYTAASGWWPPSLPKLIREYRESADTLSYVGRAGHWVARFAKLSLYNAD